MRIGAPSTKGIRKLFCMPLETVLGSRKCGFDQEWRWWIEFFGWAIFRSGSILMGKLITTTFKEKPPWRIIFSFVAWSIWKSKNLYVFNKKNQNPYLSTEIENQALEFMYCMTSPRNWILKTNRRICWEKPPAGWKKLNTNGSSIDNLTRVSCGSFIRDKHGGWVVGFVKHIGSTNNFVVELWGLRDRLVLCYNMNIS